MKDVLMNEKHFLVFLLFVSLFTEGKWVSIIEKGFSFEGNL